MDFQPNTYIRLCSTKLMLGNGHQIRFQNKDKQYEYFNSTVRNTFDEQTYQRAGSGRIVLEINIEEVNTGVNYIMFQNSNYTNKWFYANIIRVSYLNPSVTAIDYALDSFQTFMFDIDMSNNSYFDRRSYTIADGFDNIVNLPFEDLDIGSNYNTYDTTFENFIISNPDMPENTPDDVAGYLRYRTNVFYLIITTKTIDGSILSGLDSETGLSYQKYGQDSTTSFNPSSVVTMPLNYYLVNGSGMHYLQMGIVLTGIRMNGTIQSVQMLPFGSKVIDIDSIKLTDANIIKDIPELSIIADSIDKNIDFCINLRLAHKGNKFNLTEVAPLSIYAFNNVLNKYLKAISLEVDIDTVTNSTFTSTINTALSCYFYRYPYTLFEISDFGSNILTYDISKFCNGKPSTILNIPNQANAKLNLMVIYSLGCNVMCGWNLVEYGNTPDYPNAMNNRDKNNNIQQVLYYPYNYINMNGSIPVVNDYTSAFFQANQNQLSAQRTNITATLNNSLVNSNASNNAINSANVLSYNNSAIQSNTMLQNTQINANTGLVNAGLSFQNTQAGISGNMANAGLNAISNTLSGNLMGGVSSLGGAGINNYFGQIQAQNNMSMAQNSIGAMQTTAGNSAGSMMMQAQNSLMASTGIANANYANSKRNANLGYFTSMNSLNARLEDIKNIPDSVQTMGSGSTSQFLLGRLGVTLKSKSLPRHIFKRLEGYFLQYGFKSNSFEPISSVLNKYTAGGFIRTINANIVGQIPQENLQEIKSLFDAGVFIWNGEGNYMNWKEVKKQ